VYLVIGDLVAQRLVDVVETTVFEGYYVPSVRDLVVGVLPDAGWAVPVRFLLINENLGLLTVTVQYLLGVLLPLVVAFYLVLGVLEDSGLLPRLAVLSDRGLSLLGLNGRAIIPMIVGVGCVTMAVVTTRMMGSRRERLIATALLGLAVPCSAQLGVIMGLLAGLGLGWWLAYVAILLLVFGVLGVALDNVLPGESQGLLTELSPLRRPRTGDVVRKTARRTRAFLVEATPLFAGTALVVSGLDYVGGLATLERWIRPVTALLGMPAEFGRVLVIGVVRRDFAAAGLMDLGLSAPQTFVGLVVVTLFVPCILSMVMILKERNLASGALIWLGSVVVAFTVGAVLAGVFGL
jgi:ferrous iron transport protein B